ncbi:MAG: hypothetical protein NTZ17_05115 [Phycisphaerae bacterium]|nr:hypothetical protein [Phycisphaerae bacterium]
MNAPQIRHVSVIDPIGPAIERVRTVLFRPFDLERWFIIGFSAWLAQLGSGGGGGGGNRTHHKVDRESIRHDIDQAREYVANNLDWIIPVALAATVVIVGLWLLFLWLSSRGRFMFLYCVAQNKAEVTNPWRRFRGHAHSLFAFRAVVGLITLGAAILPFVLGGLVAWVSTATLGFNPLTILSLVAAVVYFVAVLIVAGVIGKFTKDFVVPIMYLHASRAVSAWQVLLDLLSVNRARFFLYVLIQIAITIAIGAMIVVSVCCTCCCAACLFALPYIGTVILLPLHVFGRSYSLYYLAQYGPEFNVFEPSPGPAATPGEPQA